jgi:hypothetical protein
LSCPLVGKAHTQAVVSGLPKFPFFYFSSLVQKVGPPFNETVSAGAAVFTDRGADNRKRPERKRNYSFNDAAAAAPKFWTL